METEYSKLKAGDFVKVSSQYRTPGYTVDMIDRVTPTMLIIGKKRFYKKDGYMVGETSWRYLTCILTTNETNRPSEAEVLECRYRIAAELALNNRREATAKTTENAKQLLTKLLSVIDPAKIQLGSQSNDGLKTNTWTLEIKGITKDEVAALEALKVAQ